jgi:hypothetical protein
MAANLRSSIAVTVALALWPERGQSAVKCSNFCTSRFKPDWAVNQGTFPFGLKNDINLCHPDK